MLTVRRTRERTDTLHSAGGAREDGRVAVVTVLGDWLRSDRSGADDQCVIRPHAYARDVTRHVTQLPAEFEVQRLEDHWLVAGPTGIFVVGRSDADPTTDAERTSVLAHHVRSALSDLMSWVPFVDALLVVPHVRLGDPSQSALACTVVEAVMLPVVLTSGAEVVGPAHLAELYHHLPMVVSVLHHNDRSTLDPA